MQHISPKADCVKAAASTETLLCPGATSAVVLLISRLSVDVATSLLSDGWEMKEGMSGSWIHLAMGCSIAKIGLRRVLADRVGMLCHERPSARHCLKHAQASEGLGG